MRVFVACWKWQDEEPELSVHQTETGAIESLIEEVMSFTDDETLSFDAQEYNDLMAGEQIGYDDLPDSGTLWVWLKIVEIQQ